MGSTEAEVKAILASYPALGRERFAGEIPQHEIYLDAYYIGKTPVTVKQYKQFCEATRRAMPAEPGGKDDELNVPNPPLGYSQQ